VQVCEYGSGGSTLFFARRAGRSYRSRTNQKWFELVTERVTKLGLKNVQVKLVPFDFKNPADSSIGLPALHPEKEIDVIAMMAARNGNK